MSANVELNHKIVIPVLLLLLSYSGNKASGIIRDTGYAPRIYFLWNCIDLWAE